MEPLGSQLPIYTSTARAIAPQNRVIVSDDSQFQQRATGSDRTNDAARGANSVFESLRGSLGNAGDLLSQASKDLSRIGDALEQIDALVKVAEENTDLSPQQRAQLSAQIDDYLTEIDDISAHSNFENKNLLADDQTITLQVGSGTSSDNRIDVELFASASEDLASGLSSIDLSDNTAVAGARTLVDAAQEALRDRQVSLEADRGSLAVAQDQNRISQGAGDNVLQAQIAASQENPTAQTQARIFENLQDYLGKISAQLENQTVTVGGFGLPEPQADPVPEPTPQQPPQQGDDPYAFDPFAPTGDRQGPEFGLGQFPFGGSPTRTDNTGSSPSSFTGYDKGGNGTSGHSGSSSGGSTNRVSVDA